MEKQKIKIEKLMSQKEKDRVMKDFKPYRADPTAGKTAPPKYSKGGRVNLRGGGCAKRGVKKNAYGKNS